MVYNPAHTFAYKKMRGTESNLQVISCFLKLLFVYCSNTWSANSIKVHNYPWIFKFNQTILTQSPLASFMRAFNCVIKPSAAKELIYRECRKLQSPKNDFTFNS